MGKELKELCVNEEGLLTLEGKVVDAKFIGPPVMVTAKTQDNPDSFKNIIWDCEEIESAGKNNGANAYLKGEVCEYHLNESVRAVQYFKINEDIKNQ